MMKRGLILWVCLILAPWAARADHYKDQLYICLGSGAATVIIDKQGQPDRLRLQALFANIADGLLVSKASVPFFKAEGSSLQRVVHVCFSSPQDLESICNALSRMPEIAYAEPVPLIKAFDTYLPDDLGANSYDGQWYLHQILAPEAWTIGRGSREVKVAVVDEGVDWQHPDLQQAMWINPGEIAGNDLDDDDNGYVDDVHGYDVAANDPDPAPHPGETHGTHVAGLVAAKSDNGIGIASMGFDLSLMGVRCSFNNSSSAFQGVIYAANAGADIVNCSWGGNGQPSATQRNAIQYALDKGCLIVSAAGNEGEDIMSFPAGFPGVISVGATTMLDRMATFSNYNEELTICAPGYRIQSTFPNNNYQNISGTSMATPIVSGLLGLMKSHYPQISNDQLKECLLSTTDSVVIHHEKYLGKTGAGRVNALKAMQCVDALKTGGTHIANLVKGTATMLIYPNPVSAQVYLDIDQAVATPLSLKITDAVGRVILTRHFSPNQLSASLPLSFSVANWASGVYLVEINQEGVKRQGKFVVR